MRLPQKLTSYPEKVVKSRKYTKKIYAPVTANPPPPPSRIWDFGGNNYLPEKKSFLVPTNPRFYPKSRPNAAWLLLELGCLANFSANRRLFIKFIITQQYKSQLLYIIA